MADELTPTKLSELTDLGEVQAGDLLYIVRSGAPGQSSFPTFEAGDVDGPSSSTDGNLASFDGASGKVIKDSGVAASSVVVGPSSATDGNVATFDGATGKKIKNSGVSISDILLSDDIGSTIQAWSTRLDTLAGLAVTDGNFIVGNGTTWVVESGATVRTSLGLGTGNSPQFAGVNLGHASDTTLTRIDSGVVGVEGSVLPSFDSVSPGEMTEGSNQLSYDVLNGAKTYFEHTLGDNAELQAPSNAPVGSSIELFIDPDGNSLTFASGYEGPDNTLPDISSEALLVVKVVSGPRYLVHLAGEGYGTGLSS